jgi:endoglucanase
MDLRSTRLRIFAPLAVAALVGCQTAPSVSTSATAPASSPPTVAPAPTQQPAAVPVSLGPIKDQVVLVDQVGYLTGAQKIGLVGDANATTFQVVDVASSQSVFSAPLGDAARDPDSGQVLKRADFSSVTKPGRYSLQVPDLGRSVEFRISDDVYRALYTDALNSYEQLAVLAPAAWQTATAKERKTGVSMDITGGWPDAGDYGRYMPSAASAMGTLLLLDDWFPSYAQPQQLQVYKRELDWMFKMQRADGAVYHKVTPLNFGGFDKGSDNIGGQLYVFDVTSPDTAVFAAIMAEASRIYRPSDAAYADRLLRSAQAAWAWLQDNPKPIVPADSEGTGGYAYNRDSTQRLWAAAELFKTTDDTTFGTYAATFLDQHSPSVGALGWSDPQTYAVLSLLSNDATEPALRSRLSDMLVHWADSTATTIQSPANPWGLSTSTFHWASNKAQLDNAVLLLVANRVSTNQHYVDAAAEQLHYVLGRNALSQSYVTEYGARPVKNPHNRTMFSIGKLVPGVLVGGPNGNAEDGITPANQGQRSYTDQLQAYASNENSVEYNAPLVFVAGLLSGTAN